MDLFGEIRMAVRRLAGTSTFLVPAAATIALSVGGASAIFALVDGVVLHPLEFPEPGEIVAIDHRAPRSGAETQGHSDQIYLHYRERSRTLAEVGAYLQ